MVEAAPQPERDERRSVSVPPASGEATAQGEAVESGTEAGRGRLLARALGSVSVLLVVAIVAMLNYLSFRHYQRFDWTRGALFTLSDKSLKVLQGLREDVHVYLFLSGSEQLQREISELLDRYRAGSSRVHVHHVDPDREPAEYKLLAQRFGLGEAMTQGGQVVADVAAVVAAGDSSWTVTRGALADVDFDSLGESEGPKLNVRSEQAFTGAIVQVVSGQPTRVCLTTGHGEWSLEPGASRALPGLREALRHDNIEFEALSTLGRQRLPAHCDAVFVLGPMRAFSEQESERVLAHARAGHGVLLALDPVIEHDIVQPTGFEGLAKQVGMQIDAALVLELDESRLMSPNVTEFRVTEFEQHTTTRALVALGGMAFVSLARSVRPADNSSASVLMRSSPKAFGERSVAQLGGGSKPSQDENDLPGPVPLALATQLPAEGGSGTGEAGRPGRLIVIGDSDWLDAALLSAPALSNLHLLVAFTGWLTEREALVSVPPKQASLGHIVFDQAALAELMLRCVVLMPLSALLIGFAVWWSRRR